MKRLKLALVNSSPAFNCLIKQYAKESIKGVFLLPSDQFNPSGTLCPAVSLPLPNEQLPPSFFAFHDTSLALIHQTSTSLHGSGVARAAAGAARTAPSLPLALGISAAGAGLRLFPF